jgi:exosome complex RNA-binding protein Rrp4
MDIKKFSEYLSEGFKFSDKQYNEIHSRFKRGDDDSDIIKWISSNIKSSKYSPSVGDIVVGTVIEISNKRWKIDILSENESYLHLNSSTSCSTIFSYHYYKTLRHPCC